MKLHKIEKENFDLRDKLRVYDLIIDRHDLGRFFGKNRDMGRSRDEAKQGTKDDGVNAKNICEAILIGRLQS